MSLNVGLDIGYGNLKVSYGEHPENPVSLIFPAGAGPEDSLTVGIGRIGKMKKSEEFNPIGVTVEGDRWVACADTSMFENVASGLHPNYPKEKKYRALFLAALVHVANQTGKDTIDTLFTGLPSAQYLKYEKGDHFLNWMKGTHQVNNRQKVTVKDIHVVPQPMGAYLTACVENDDEYGITDSSVLVFDVGHYSVDWTVFAKHRMEKKSMGSSTHAMSELIEKTAELIYADLQLFPENSTIEECIRKSKPLSIGRELVDLNKYISKAAEMISPLIKDDIQRILNLEGRDTISYIVPTGGGAKYYLNVIEKIFPRSIVLQPKNPIVANSLGYWAMSFLKE